MAVCIAVFAWHSVTVVSAFGIISIRESKQIVEQEIILELPSPQKTKNISTAFSASMYSGELRFLSNKHPSLRPPSQNLCPDTRGKLVAIVYATAVNYHMVKAATLALVNASLAKRKGRHGGKGRPGHFMSRKAVTKRFSMVSTVKMLYRISSIIFIELRGNENLIGYTITCFSHVNMLLYLKHTASTIGSKACRHPEG